MGKKLTVKEVAEELNISAYTARKYCRQGDLKSYKIGQGYRVDKEDLDISIKDDVLSISGKKKEEKTEEDSDYYRTERAYGKFQRSFRLHDVVDEENIEAEYDQGVLTVNIPKKEETTPAENQIEIKYLMEV